MRSLDKYFKYLGSTRIRKELNLLREYPRYDEIIKRYKEKFEISAREPVEIPKISKGQVYTIPYNLAGGDIFELNISIDKLYNLVNDDNNELIVKNNENYNKELTLKSIKSDKDIEKMNFNSQVLKMILDERNIDKKYAKNCVNNNEDILCADFQGITSERIPFVILDGNHRCYAKIKEGHKLINGLLVSRNVWINCLLTEADKMFIKIFYNMNLILSYRSGRCNKDYIDKRLYNI